MSQFTHLHLHTQFSVLDGANEISKLMARVKELGMDSVAITDHGNMFGVKEFHKQARKNDIKPIIGCEAYLARRGRHNKTEKIDARGEHIILLAKNQTGYKNLMKLVSAGFTEGYYYNPRIDKELLFEHSEGLIVSTACLGGPVPQAVLKGDLEAAERIAAEYKEVFGEDFYLELQRHKTDNPERNTETFHKQEKVNTAILDISKKLGIKVIATNDVHFLGEEDADAHNILVLLSTGKTLSDNTQMSYSGEEYLKSPEEMAEIFADIPEAISNTQEIVAKIEDFELERKPIMPAFALPEGFDNEADYLRHIVFEGAKERWGEITPEIEERLNFELDTIIGMGFPGYFLIVWDFIKAAREMGVVVGPGRGSAAGSAVAYVLTITDIDPIKYGLLFERFLNPDRISMPDIDIDFDDDGREKILKWVVNKYGENRVANIITYGTMASKSSIRDVARVMELPLSEADRMAKLVPDKVKNLSQAYDEVEDLKKAYETADTRGQVLDFARQLEGSVRQTGVHACGIIISRDDLTEHVPVCTSKEADLLVTQYEGSQVEDIGLLKMDFLGLKTLSIIKEAVEKIEHSKGVEIDIEHVDLEDKKVFELFSRGETTGLFQFESDGMKKHLRNLKPTHFEDLIAMNALYRPGPMDYIDSFIRRKHGKEKIEYDLPEMEEILQTTYGITVYQEQVMLLSQKLAGFTKGQADSLRKAMGKKIISMMNDLREKFYEGCEKNGYERKTVEKIWHDWEKFAQYAFNRSHSVCYAYLAYQTAYLKAHYPAEFMAAVLSRNLSEITKVTIFMEEIRRMGLEILGPDVNESFYDFVVNENDAIRFGLGAIKGVGKGAVEAIVAERNENGKFKDFNDFVERVNLNTVNKRTAEALVMAGAFDNISNAPRSAYFYKENDNTPSYIEEVIKYGSRFQGEGDAGQHNIFGGAEAVEIKKPVPPHTEPWELLERLNKEKDLIGIYLSEHPLDKYRLEIDQVCTPLSKLSSDLGAFKGQEIKTAGIITAARHATTKTGKPYGTFDYEDFTGNFRVFLFGKDYLNLKNYLTKGYQIFVRGKVGHRFDKPDNDLEYKINSIEMLADVKDTMLNDITVKLPIEKISDELINEFMDFVKQNNGKAGLNFLVFDPETKVWIKMHSRSKRVNLNQSFVNYLKEKPYMQYKIS
jgi:DNA polymerase-3 subunit alpha